MSKAHLVLCWFYPLGREREREYGTMQSSFWAHILRNVHYVLVWIVSSFFGNLIEHGFRVWIFLENLMEHGFKVWTFFWRTWLMEHGFRVWTFFGNLMEHGFKVWTFNWEVDGTWSWSANIFWGTWCNMVLECEHFLGNLMEHGFKVWTFNWELDGTWSWSVNMFWELGWNMVLMCELGVHFLGTSWNTSYFNCSLFELAIRGTTIMQ
jgi:hypothetical protein